MLVTLLNVLTVDGKEEDVSLPVEMEQFQYRGEIFPIAGKEPLCLHLLHKEDKQVVVSGGTRLSLLIPCARCLESIRVPFSIRFEYELDLKQTREDRAADMDETSFLGETDLDTERLVYNEILINWPIRVLCKEDCQGICSHCGANLNKETCNCGTSQLDPRMAAISDIFSKFKEV